MLKKIFSIFVFLSFPALAFAVDDIEQLYTMILGIIVRLVDLSFIFIMAAFTWGVVRFLLNTQDQKKMDEAKQWILWAVIAFFVAVTLWGIMQALIDQFNINPIVIPRLGR